MLTSEDYKAERLGHYGQLGSYCVAETEIGFAKIAIMRVSQISIAGPAWFTEGPVPPSEIRLPITSGWIRMPLGEVTCSYLSTPVTSPQNRTHLCNRYQRNRQFLGPTEEREHRNASCFLATGTQAGVVTAVRGGDNTRIWNKVWTSWWN